MQRAAPVMGTSLSELLETKAFELAITATGDVEDSSDRPLAAAEDIPVDESTVHEQTAPAAIPGPETTQKPIELENNDHTEPGERFEADEPVEIDDIELLYSFIEESQDHLERIEEKILTLETTRDAEVIDEIFRSMHTMKGTSSFFGFDTIRKLSHSLESLLDELRAEEISLSQRLIDVLLTGTDTLTRMVSDIKYNADQAKPDGVLVIPSSRIDPRPILSEIKILLTDADSHLPLSKTGNVNEDAPESLITDEIQDSFISESRDLLNIAQDLILEIENTPNSGPAIDGAFRCIHNLKGNAGFLGYPELEKACTSLEEIFETLRGAERAASQTVVGRILSSIDSLRSMLDPGSANSAQDDESQTSDSAYRPLGSILVDMGEITQDEIDSALDQQEKKLGEILIEQGRVSSDIVEKALSSQQVNTEAPPRQTDRKDIRVDMKKLDKLFDLMGELITAEAMVIHNPALEGIQLEGFESSTNYLSKITREMQELTMGVRMIPLDGLFNKMRRLHRDLTKRFDKQIDLVISGQDTEMDRSVIEEIADPLMHIIRNAIDHGVESSTQRIQSGKSGQGILSLDARYEGNEIWISVADDGAGLNRDRILFKAAERELVGPDAESMRDEDIWQLIFEPGFSTAESVSDISGRGVGMDVVKKNVEKLRGKIDVASEPGFGTTFTLRIPLTLAIIDGITARSNGMLYALPLSDILEFHKASNDQLTRTTADRQVIRLREDIIPIINLSSFFAASTDDAKLKMPTDTLVEDGILVIIQRHDRKAAILVDEIADYQQIVVKSLPGYLEGMRAVSGCSILGSGDVSLIIDVGALLDIELDRSY